MPATMAAAERLSGNTAMTIATAIRRCQSLKSEIVGTAANNPKNVRAMLAVERENRGSIVRPTKHML